MAVFLGQFSAPVSTGNHSITGVGFEPVAVWFWSVQVGLADPANSLGAATGAGEEWCIFNGLDDQASTYDRRYRDIRNDRCISIMSQPVFTTAECTATFVSMDSDGFTVNFTTAGNAELIYYVAVGGLNVSAAKAGIVSAGGSTGTTSVTGTGFTPRALMMAHTMDGSTNTLNGTAIWGTGFADASLNQYSSMASAIATVQLGAAHIHRTDAVACGVFSGDTYRLVLDSMDSDGFTLDCPDAFSSDMNHGYVAIDCAAAHVGNALIPDSTGVVSYSTPGMEPGGVLFGWNGVDNPSTSGATGAPTRPGFGAMDGTTGGTSPDLTPSHANMSYLHRNAAPFGAYVPTAFLFGTNAVAIYGAGSQVDPGANALQAGGAFNAFNMGSFELNWGTATAGFDRTFGWLALPGDIQAPWIPRIIRRVPGI